MRKCLLVVSLVGSSWAGGAHADSRACKAGALVFGDPMVRGDNKPNPKGQTVRQSPPLDWSSFVLGKGKVVTVSGHTQEIWGGNVSGAIKLIAGEAQSGMLKFGDGACDAARFVSIWGIATLRDGTIVAADNGAHAIRLVSDPYGPGCKVTTVVGPSAPFSGQTPAASLGDKDGPAKDAKIGSPAWPLADSSGNVYFIDLAAEKVKMVAGDAGHTVSTIASLKSPDKIQAYPGMTMLDEKLYIVGNNYTSGFVIEVDPETKKVKVIRGGNDKVFPPVSAHAPSLSSITSDGTSLLITGQSYIWRLSKDGKNLSFLAGRGFDLEYPTGYNPAGVYPLKELFLRFRSDEASQSGSSTWMVWDNNALYWRGRHDSGYVLKIGCP